MPKAYCVVYQDYEEFEIHGVFTNKEAAERFLGAGKLHPKYQVLEYDLNPPGDIGLLPYWFVSLSLKGDVVEDQNSADFNKGGESKSWATKGYTPTFNGKSYVSRQDAMDKAQAERRKAFGM